MVAVSLRSWRYCSREVKFNKMSGEDARQRAAQVAKYRPPRPRLSRRRRRSLSRLRRLRIFTPRANKTASYASLLRSRYFCRHATLLPTKRCVGVKRCVTTQITAAWETTATQARLRCGNMIKYLKRLSVTIFTPILFIDELKNNKIQLHRQNNSNK